MRERARHVDRFVATSNYYKDYMTEFLAVPSQKVVHVDLGLSLSGHGEASRRPPERPFVIGYLAVASMQMIAINGDTNARKITEAATLAADRLETLMVVPYENIASGGPVTEGAYSISWQVTDDSPLPDTKTITVNVSWQHAGPRNFEATFFKTANL